MMKELLLKIYFAKLTDMCGLGRLDVISYVRVGVLCSQKSAVSCTPMFKIPRNYYPKRVTVELIAECGIMRQQ